MPLGAFTIPLGLAFTVLTLLLFALGILFALGVAAMVAAWQWILG